MKRTRLRECSFSHLDCIGIFPITIREITILGLKALGLWLTASSQFATVNSTSELVPMRVPASGAWSMMVVRGHCGADK